MIISVASGKGGTGKTTIAVSLALSVGGDVQLLDCDVEEPNAHLFLQPDFQERITVYTPVPLVDEDKCTRCGACADLCQFKAIVVIADTVLTFDQLCHSCGGCMAVCPEKAVSEKGRELGIIEKGRAKGIELIHGKLRVGEAMAPPLIRKVREHAGPYSLTIIDAPPGTSCPVVASMKGTDFVVLVTEPTPFGLYDLKLAVGAVRILGIPFGLVINRADMGDDMVRRYAEEEDIEVLMEIPFDRGIAEAYSRGEAMVDVFPEQKAAFQRLYKRIKEVVGGGS
jgi:MinD superfamily P-loop ATPase